MFTEFAGAIQSVKLLGELLKGAQSLANYHEVMTAVSIVSSKLMEAQNVALSSQDAQLKQYARIRELEAELQKIAGWESQSARYALQELAPGKFAYALTAESANGEPHHMLCPNCFVKHQKALLQLNVSNELGQWYDCHSCKNTLHIPTPASGLTSIP